MIHLAEASVERDKERGGVIVETMPTTNDAVAAHARPAPQGKPLFCPSTALLLLDVSQRTRLRRRALHTGKIGASKCIIYYVPDPKRSGGKFTIS